MEQLIYHLPLSSSTISSIILHDLFSNFTSVHILLSFPIHSIVFFMASTPGSASCSQVSLPLVSDDIVVCFISEDGRRVWWGATVVSIDPTSADLASKSTIIASATILYHAAFGMNEELAKIEFVHGNFIRVKGSNGNTELAAWMMKYVQDSDDGSDAEVSHRPKRHRKEDCGYHYKQLRRTSSRVQMNKPQSKGNTLPAIKENCSSPTLLKMEDLIRTNESLLRRICAIESKMSADVSCDHSTIISSLVREIQVSAKLSLLASTQRPLKRFQGQIANEPFDAILRRDTIDWSSECDWLRFSYIVKSLLDCDRDSNVGLIFHPSLSTLMKETATVDEAYIIFPSAATLFRWLGVGNELDIVQALSTQWESGNGSWRRVLGGAQWSPGDSPCEVNVYFGSSCCMEQMHDDDEDFPTCKSVRPAIRFGSNGWDAENNRFKGIAKLVDGRHCTSCAHVTEGLHSFCIRWKITPQAHQKKFSRLAVSTEGVHRGTIQISIPVVLLRGAAAVQVNDFISGELVREVLL